MPILTLLTFAGMPGYVSAEAKDCWGLDFLRVVWRQLSEASADEDVISKMLVIDREARASMATWRLQQDHVAESKIVCEAVGAWIC